MSDVAIFSYCMLFCLFVSAVYIVSRTAHLHVSLFQDPEVQMAFADISSNPANILKYQDNPKIKKVMEKLQKKYGPDTGAADTPPDPEPASEEPPPTGPSDMGLD